MLASALMRLPTRSMHAASPPARRAPAGLAAITACLSLCASPVAWTAEPPAPPADDTLLPQPTAWRLSYENFKLPRGERMGMAGATLLFEADEHLSLGLATYAAVRGQRGGFITLGLSGELRQRLSENWWAQAGLHVGAGGGRDGQALAGGGLMLRADAGVSYRIDPAWRVGLGVSHVRFPSGVIRSTQPYLMAEHGFHSLAVPGWRGSGTGGTSLGTREQELSLVARHYAITGSAMQDNGLPQHPHMQLLGIEWLSHLDERWFLKLEAEGAGGGRSDGYMQILAGAGYRLPLAQGTALKAHGALGAAGGGRVDTGGGFVVDAGLALQQQLGRNLWVELGAGGIRAPSRSFQARSLALRLTHRFGIPAVGEQAVPASALGGFEPLHLRVRLAQQTYFKAADGWRRDFRDRAVSNLGAQLDCFLSPNFFLTGQGLAAYGGRAGAYMTGLVGAGMRTALPGPWYLEGEALGGVAGGGGLAVGGGAVAQANASLGLRLSPALTLQATVGHLAALKGDLRAHVAGLSLAYEFTAFERR